MISLPAFTHFDKKATALLVVLASSFGAAGAVLWKMFAWDVFSALHVAASPASSPRHPFILAAITAAGVSMIAHSHRAKDNQLAAANVRVAVPPPVSHVRIAGEVELDDEEEVLRPASKTPRRLAGWGTNLVLDGTKS